MTEVATPETDRVSLLVSAAEISTRIEELAERIVEDFEADARGDGIQMIAVLKGAFVFAADLLRALGRRGARVRVDFLHLESYGQGRAAGPIEVRGPVPQVMRARPVLLVEDVLDTGRCAAHAIELLTAQGAGPVRVCALLDKPARRVSHVQADYAGFTVPDQFIIGYGIDCAERWRELPYVATLEGEG